MTPTEPLAEIAQIELAATEHAEHVVGWNTTYDGKGGIAWADAGGLRCSCGWTADHDEVRRMRPWRAWSLHVAEAMLRAAFPPGQTPTGGGAV